VDLLRRHLRLHRPGRRQQVVALAIDSALRGQVRESSLIVAARFVGMRAVSVRLRARKMRRPIELGRQDDKG